MGGEGHFTAMCNHYSHERRKAGLELEILGYEEFSETRIDLFPDRVAPVLCEDRQGMPDDRATQSPLRAPQSAPLRAPLRAKAMRWGFPPPPSASHGRVVTNLRNTDSPFWRPWLVPAQRCLVPFTTFAEYTDSSPRREAWFALAGDRNACFAGIWRPWRGDRGTKSAPVSGDHLVFAILTCAPNNDVKPIHAKAMPVILKDAEAQLAWLSAPVSLVPALAVPLADGVLQRAA